MKFLVAAVALTLLLGGCAEFLIRAATDAADLHQATRDYLLENKAQRIHIRSECRKSVDNQIEQARETDGEAAVQQILRDNYPRLVTTVILDGVLEDNAAGILSTPPSCGVDLGVFRQ